MARIIVGEWSKDARRVAEATNRNAWQSAARAAGKHLRYVDVGEVLAQRVPGQSAPDRVSGEIVPNLVKQGRADYLLEPYDYVVSRRICSRGCYTGKDQAVEQSSGLHGRLVVMDIPPINFEVVGEVVIDPDQFLMKVGWRRSDGSERYRCVRRVRERHEVLNDLDGVLVHHALGNRVVAKWLPRYRIFDRRWEYAISHRLCRELASIDLERARATPFLRKEKECLLFAFVVELGNPHRAAQAPAEVVVPKRRLEDRVARTAQARQRRCDERVARLQYVIADEFVCAAVELFAAASCHHIDNTSGVPAKLRIV